MNFLTVLGVIIMMLITIALLVYAVVHSFTNVNHLRSFTPTCPNCGRDIRATNENEPRAKNRLRDHLKQCEA